ncbi:polyprenyl synthetase family protein [Seonamhaeicola algicola]|uniref:Polyprenyl synthetase family protein n=2 Tax=Seonamhaeicola TaxID=1649495 RepID=A0A5C7AVC6_9FLAO|nr:polyprenyl synthetase family protein [Seonamhaeicola algicola]TXE12726.1 polyprenyl synthetase family protein [Seonamhaeicola algicola]
MLSIEKYQEAFLNFLKTNNFERQPKGLYNPVNYILGLGGKRLRPVLTLMCADIFQGSYQKALKAAMAVEVFHNFTLVHDDIMDDAPLRRGKVTVHEKWDINTGILSGDAMLILAYQLFEDYDANTFKALTKLFSETALQVCEGQQYDVDFETRNDVTIAEYLTMIEYKTAVLVAAAMQMGAIIAEADIKNQQSIYQFGRNLGIAFQLQDDYLDAFGNPETFGKQVGGDIIENKKTYLYLKALEFADANEKQRLIHLFNTETTKTEEKIFAVKELFKSTGAAKATKQAVAEYTNKAFKVLEVLDISEDKKQLLKTFGSNLMRRNV